MLDPPKALSVLADLEAAGGTAAAALVEGMADDGEPMPGVVIVATGDEALALAEAYREIHGDADVIMLASDDASGEGDAPADMPAA